MKNPILIILFILLCFNIFSQDTLCHHLLFDNDSHDISKFEAKKLDDFMLKVKEHKIDKALLTGHTDNNASHEYNLELSKKRVNRVGDFLFEKYKLDSERKHYGKTMPLNNNSLAKEKQLNRRVEIAFIIDNEIYKEPYKEYTLKDLYKELSLDFQEFCINPNRDTTITLEQGTILDINANTFHSKSSCITLKAKEVYTYSDMFFENLTTSSFGKQLETGGMIFLDATDKSGKKLKPNESMSILMPTNEIKSDMQVFYGDKDQEEGINWRLEDSAESNRMVGLDFFGEGSFIPPIDLSNECKFFWCKIGNAVRSVGGVFSRELRYRNEIKRNQYKQAENIKHLMDSLGVKNYEELYAHMAKERQKKIEERIEKGDANIQDISYYAFRTSNLGWINCDRFNNVNPKIVMKTPIAHQEGVDIKLFFKSFKSIMPANNFGDYIAFRGIKEKESVNYIAVKTENGKIYLSMIDTRTTKNAPKPEFQEVTLESLKEKIKGLNG